MSLPNPFAGVKKPRESHVFLGLDIDTETVTAGLWSVEHNKVKLHTTSKSVEWKDEPGAGVIEAADVALGELGDEAQHVSEVVLGLPESWVKDQAITGTRKTLLKNLKEQLQIKPLGFVVTTEALTRYLQELEGGPINAILAHYKVTTIAVTLVKAGRIEKTESIGRSGDSVADLSEGLARFGSAVFPARLIIFGAQLDKHTLETEKQTLLAYDWQKQSGFLHVPKVETLPSDATMSAVCIAGGGEIAASLGYMQQTASARVNIPVAVGSVQEPVGEPTAQVAPENIAQDVGFHEIEEIVEAEPLDEKLSPGEPPQESETVEPVSNIVPLPKKAWRNPFAGFAITVEAVVRKLFKSFTAGRNLNAKMRVNVSGINFRLIIIIVLAVVVVGGAIGAFALANAVRADVVITLKTSPIAKDMDITLDPQAAQTDSAKNVLKVETVEKEVSGSKEADTTGAKIIGDKAVGKVTIYNATNGEKTFPAGTVLTGPNKLKFVLNDDVIVASSSGSSLLNTEWGKVTTNVTASAIGAESNLPAKTEFAIANFDKKTYVASNDEAFSGGTSREIRAVSKDDVVKLTAALTKELKDQAVAALSTDAKPDQQIISTDDITVVSTQVSAQVGEEAQLVNVSMTLTARGLRYTSADLLPIAQEQLKDQLPQNAVLRQEKTNIVTQSLVKEEPVYKLKVSLLSEAIPSLDKAALVALIRGKTVAQAESLIKDNGNVAGVNITMHPSFSTILFGSMPKSAERITIQTKL